MSTAGAVFTGMALYATYGVKPAPIVRSTELPVVAPAKPGVALAAAAGAPRL